MATQHLPLAPRAKVLSRRAYSLNNNHRGHALLLPLAQPYCQVTSDENEERVSSTISWKNRLLHLSNLASILCVVDCTVLPLLTIMLSLLGLAEQPHRLEWLHELGHQVAINFVLPVGALTTFLNLISHRQASLTIPALVGLVLIYLANSSHKSHNHTSSTHEEQEEAASILHWALHTGQTHRLTNIMGCALLLISNYRAQRLGKCQDKNCKHANRK